MTIDTKPRWACPRNKPRKLTKAQRLYFSAPIGSKVPPTYIPRRDRMGVR